jgi:hypothetical protein
MQHRRPAAPDAEVLSPPVAARLLDRASELDAALRAGAAVSDLRAAATEAGISAHAFDAALAELRDDPGIDGAQRTRRRSRLWTAAVAGIAVLATIAVWTVGRTPVATSVAEQSFVLRCLSPREAARLVRPLLGENGVTLITPAQAPRVLTIRGTPAQLRDAKALLDKQDAAGSAACVAESAPVAPR